MSISSEITRISNNVQNTIDTIGATGVTVPDGANSDDLPSLAQALANTKQDKLTGAEGQVVGFDESGNAVAQEAPSGLPTGGTPGQILYHGESGPEWGDKPVMYVTVTLESGSSYGTSSKSSEEIYQAVLDGYAVYAVITNSSSALIVPLLQSDSNLAYFNCMQEGALIVISIAKTVAGIYSGPLPSNLVGFTPGTTGLTAKNVQDAIEEVNEKIPSAPKSVSITLPASGWSSNTQTVTVNGVLADESAQLIQPMPAVASQNTYISAGVICSGQAANQLSFTCSTTPTEDISLYVVLTEVQS